MSIKSKDTDEVIKYVADRIEADHAEVLVVFYNNVTDENIATPMGSDLPEGFHVIGSFYWDDNAGQVLFKAVESID